MSWLLDPFENLFPGDANPQIVDCSTPIMRDHSYWPIVSDIINVFSHRYIVVDYFLSNRDLLSYWAKIIACFQGKEKMEHNRSI